MTTKEWLHPNLTPEKLAEIVAGAFAREGHLFIFAVTSDKADTEFISYAPWAIRELAKERDALRVERDKLKAELDAFNSEKAKAFQKKLEEFEEERKKVEASIEKVRKSLDY